MLDSGVIILYSNRAIVDMCGRAYLTTNKCHRRSNTLETLRYKGPHMEKHLESGYYPTEGGNPYFYDGGNALRY